MSARSAAGVKICGINDAEGFDAAVTAGADWIGFNFFPASPRYVMPATAAALSAGRTGGPARVALFVEPTDAEVAAVTAAFRPDVLQVYADVARVAALRARFGLPVWRAVGVTGPEDLPDTAAGADALLIESKAPPGATRPGGRAARFDWGVLSGWAPGFGWLLAGGLTPANVAEAIRVTGAPAVDVASGVERIPGRKDPALIAAFVAAAKAA